jgi:deoxyribonuclease-1
MLKKILSITAIILAVGSGQAAAGSFSSAKNKMPEIYSQLSDPKTLYCGCDIINSGKKLTFDSSSCGLEPRKEAKRSIRLEYEHVVSAWEIGHQMQCWQDGGRKNCAKNNPLFKEAEGNLHNLFAAEGEINGNRNNFQLGMIPGEARQYGQCDFEIDFKGKTAEPRDSVRGDIARVYFYMAKTYNIRLSSQKKKLYDAWDKLDPVDPAECKLNKVKAKYQGEENPFVSKHCS